jgi:hypothetical protein
MVMSSESRSFERYLTPVLRDVELSDERLSLVVFYDLLKFHDSDNKQKT